jgi:intermediate cleaving peptidase 55
MDSLPEGSVVVLPGGRLQYSSGSIFYKFRQISDFFYLTGWLEHDAAVILGQIPSCDTVGNIYSRIVVE